MTGSVFCQVREHTLWFAPRLRGCPPTAAHSDGAQAEASALARSLRISHPAILRCPLQADDELPKPEEIEVEFQDLYRHDEEQAYLTLMSQEIKSINFPCEENYTVRLCVRRRPLTHPPAHSAHSP